MQIGNYSDNNLPSDFKEFNDMEFKPLPPGDYPVVIDKSEVKTTSSGTGSYINLTLKVVGSNHTGRLIFDRITTRNQSVQAQQIGDKRMQQLRIACGIPVLTDDQQLLQKQLIVTVGIEPAKDGYDAKNNVKKYIPLNGQTHQTPQQQPQSTPYNYAGQVGNQPAGVTTHQNNGMYYHGQPPQQSQQQPQSYQDQSNGSGTPGGGGGMPWQ